MKKGASIKTFAQSMKEDDSVTKAQVLLANFITQHNLAASVANHFYDLCWNVS